MFHSNSRRFNIRTLAVLIVLVTLSAGAISTGQISRLANTLSNTQSPTSTGKYFEHVLIIVMEDRGLQDICGQNPPPCLSSTGASYMATLANKNGIGSQYLGMSHFSEADYLALLGGDTFGCSNSGCPPVSNQNLIDRLESAGLSWKAYIENQNIASGCDATYHEPYTPEHNPFVVFSDIANSPSRCSKVVLANPSGCSVTDCSLVNDLNSASAPNFMWLTPNNCDNMHGFTGICPASVSYGDNYTSGLIPNIIGSTTFTTQRSALFVVFDEGNGYCPLNGSAEDCVYAVWAGPEAKSKFTSSHLYNHYSFVRTVEDNWNLQTLTNNDANATPMTEFFTSTPAVLLSTSFTYSPASPGVAQYVRFTASGSGGTSPYSFTWNFGDGTNATGATPYHAYSTTGSYAVVLTTIDGSTPQQTASSQQTITVTSQTPPPSNLRAGFSYSISNPTVGQTISFSGAATGGTQPYTYSWNFGDSSTGSGANISHIFQSPGTFDVVLTVTDSAGGESSANHSITAIAALSGSFTYSPTNPTILQSILFTANAAGGTAPYTYSWDFGDGATAAGSSASHSYLLPGTYNAALTVTDSNGHSITLSQSIAVSLGVTIVL